MLGQSYAGNAATINTFNFLLKTHLKWNCSPGTSSMFASAQPYTDSAHLTKRTNIETKIVRT